MQGPEYARSTPAGTSPSGTSTEGDRRKIEVRFDRESPELPPTAARILLRMLRNYCQQTKSERERTAA